MLCSVVIPTWNRAAVLPRAIDSCLAQTYSPLEILIMDDGGTDNSTSLVHELYASRVLPEGKSLEYHVLPHRGVSAARNAGLRLAKGETIAYLDSDNAWLPNCLSDLLAPLRQGASCAYGMVEILPSELYGHHVLFRPFNREELLYQNFIDLNVFVHKADLIATCDGFDESLTRLVDWDFILRLTEKDCPAQVRSVVARYSHNSSLERITSHMPLKENLKKIIEKNIRAIWKSSVPGRLHDTKLPLWCGTLAHNVTLYGEIYEIRGIYRYNKLR